MLVFDKRRRYYDDDYDALSGKASIELCKLIHSSKPQYFAQIFLFFEFLFSGILCCFYFSLLRKVYKENLVVYVDIVLCLVHLVQRWLWKVSFTHYKFVINPTFLDNIISSQVLMYLSSCFVHLHASKPKYIYPILCLSGSTYVISFSPPVCCQVGCI